MSTLHEEQHVTGLEIPSQTSTHTTTWGVPDSDVTGTVCRGQRSNSGGHARILTFSVHFFTPDNG
jgi:hypothetical protein